MKFARYLNSHAIDEWRRAYIQYRQLKKQIGRAADELADLDDGGTGGANGDAAQRTAGVSTAATERDYAARVREAQRVSRGSAVPGAREPGGGLSLEQRDLERGRNSDAEDDEDDPPPAPRPHEHHKDATPPSTPTAAPPATSPIHSPGLSALSSSFGEPNSDDTHNSRRPLTRLDGRRSPAQDGRKSPAQDEQSNGHAHGLPHPFTRKDSKARDTLAGRPGDSRRKWREGFSASMELDEVVEKCPPQCRRFFTMLDRELERVSGFYADREEEAAKRYEELSAQWRELAIHKKEFQEFRERELHPPAFVTSLFPKNQHISHIPGAQIVRRTLAHRKQRAKDTQEAEDDSPPQRRLSGSDAEDDRDGEDADDEGAAPRQVYRHRRPEEYTNARSKLKLATFEFYRSLGMLKSYRVLNRTGFAKALKKFEKATAIPCSAKYSEKVEKANFSSSPKLEDLIRETENAFANVFERGDRKKALERLRDFGQKKRHHFSTWRAGALMGAALPLAIEGLVLSFKASTRREIPYWPALMQLFGACFLPVFFALAFFLNLAAWSHARINYVLIFELDVRNRLDYHQYLELPALLFFTLSLFWWAAWQNFWPNDIAPSAYPLAWIVLMLVIMLNPFPLFFPSARWWMLRSFCRMIMSGLVAVEFRDFFLGDELNSLYYSIYNLGFLYCTYSHGFGPNTFSVCSTNKTWTTAILSCLPPFFRLGQSLRRYVDSDGILHLLNAGKYSVSIAYFFAYYGWRIHEANGDNVPWRLALFIIFASFNSIYTSAWDIYMDWSLGHRDVKDRSHFLLRNELAFFKDAPWVYYLASIANVVLRFAWVLYFSPKPSTPVLGYIIALIEAARRIMWNSLRVEAEHIGNRDGYRVTREVGLPYVTASSPEAAGSLVDDADADTDSSEPLAPHKRAFAFLHSLHGSLVRNFRPVLNAVWSPPLLPLGVREDPVEQERREVEGQERRKDREGVRRRRASVAGAARRGRRRSTAGDGGPDDSSEPSDATGDEDSPRSGAVSPTGPKAGPSGSGSGSGAQAGESPEEDAGKLRQDESEPDEVDQDRELEQGMQEVAQMTDLAKGASSGEM
ncbi:Xenotropic and polytropic retrovirus receptor 1 [Rhodotorula kratochvilovae]